MADISDEQRAKNAVDELFFDRRTEWLRPNPFGTGMAFCPDPFYAAVAAAIRDARRAERERVEQAVSAERCPECRAGDVPEYDERYKAWYHDRLLCLGSTARLAIRALSDD
jgi:hypothetical protein